MKNNKAIWSHLMWLPHYMAPVLVIVLTWVDFCRLRQIALFWIITIKYFDTCIIWWLVGLFKRWHFKLKFIFWKLLQKLGNFLAFGHTVQDKYLSCLVTSFYLFLCVTFHFFLHRYFVNFCFDTFLCTLLCILSAIFWIKT